MSQCFLTAHETFSFVFFFHLTVTLESPCCLQILNLINKKCFPRCPCSWLCRCPLFLIMCLSCEEFPRVWFCIAETTGFINITLKTEWKNNVTLAHVFFVKLFIFPTEHGQFSVCGLDLNGDLKPPQPVETTTPTATPPSAGWLTPVLAAPQTYNQVKSIIPFLCVWFQSCSLFLSYITRFPSTMRRTPMKLLIHILLIFHFVKQIFSQKPCGSCSSFTSLGCRLTESLELRRLVTDTNNKMTVSHWRRETLPEQRSSRV